MSRYKVEVLQCDVCQSKEALRTAMARDKEANPWYRAGERDVCPGCVERIHGFWLMKDQWRQNDAR